MNTFSDSACEQQAEEDSGVNCRDSSPSDSDSPLLTTNTRANTSPDEPKDAGSDVKNKTMLSGNSESNPASKHFNLMLLGCSVLDKRITQPLLPWIVAEVKHVAQGKEEAISLEVSQHTVRGIVNRTGKTAFCHHLQGIGRFCRGIDKEYFSYLWRRESDKPFTCFVFKVDNLELVGTIHSAIREAAKHVEGKSYSQNESHQLKEMPFIGDTILDSSNSYEVLYCGRVVVSHKKAPPSLIDEAIAKFKEFEISEDYSDRRRRHFSTGDQSRSRSNSVERKKSQSVDDLDCVDNMLLRNTSSESLDSKTDSECESDIGIPRCNSDVSNSSSTYMSVHRGSVPTFDRQLSIATLLMRKHNPQNRTMLFQIGKETLTLISPGKKTAVMAKRFCDISFCSQGIKHPAYFGFICREKGSYMCYVFKCQSEPVVGEILVTLKQSFQAAMNNIKTHIVCESCPMHKLHKLSQELDGLIPDEVHSRLMKKLEKISDVNNIPILQKLKDANLKTKQEENERMMSMLLGVCRQEQKIHIHISHTQEKVLQESPKSSRMEAKPTAQTSKLENLKNRAKRSLLDSFLSKGRSRSNTEKAASKSADESGLVNPHYKPHSNSFSTFSNQSSSESPKSPTKAIQSYSPNKTESRTPKKSPSMENKNNRKKLDLRDVSVTPMRPRSKTLGDSPTTPPLSRRQTPPARKEFTSPRPVIHRYGGTPVPLSRTMSFDDRRSTHMTSSPYSSMTPRRQTSWRQAIFNRVVTPAKAVPEISEEDEELVFDDNSSQGDNTDCIKKHDSRFKTKAMIRALWRKVIMEQIILIRMERENRRIEEPSPDTEHLDRLSQDMATLKRQKLDYEEITPCLKEVTKKWEKILSKPDRSRVRFDPYFIADAVREGVPRQKRGEIWLFLAEQYLISHTTTETDDLPKYHNLLSQLTTHQHAILIDLGRTYPTHPYFSNPLGRGQLSLFNLLKAYSLLDSEVGYCQGLSFVAGLLLMHIEEEEAFQMMQYLMFHLSFRRQYKPDMVALQIQMYQLSRLLHDHHRRLHDHLEANDIGPSLYAAAWFLTIFTSQFPLGFVARVFDLIFLQGFDVIFKVALIILGSHEELILQCDGFEAIIEFLKDTLPSLGIVQMEKVINKTFELDISKELHAYEVEYHVIQEEMVNTPQSGDQLASLEAANLKLKRQNMELIEQLQSARNARHSQEATVQHLQASETKLRSEKRTLELEREALLSTIQKLQSLIPEHLLQDSGINFTFPTKSTTNKMASKSKDKTINSIDELEMNITPIKRTVPRPRMSSSGSSGSELSSSTYSEDSLAVNGSQEH
ncbi:TBC1 domain family member 1-like isoform X2 [Anneissia japonica]|uniref:TBC1 domain family member 1-like isoform X2 n=1 Tax=Anneissia japonica TaxID=1529436 RepID=UPI0014254EFA|nr:TBC1 domain family member 1-like isoform X2 [Anneissia japonica]